MAEKLSIGIVGIGMMGCNHIEFLQQSKVCQLTALCARNKDSFSKVKPEIIEKVRCYTDYDEFLADPELDIVLIATPHRSHAELALKAMQHHKHLLIEKPVAVHKQETDRLLAEAALYPELAVSVLFNQRCWPLHCKVKAMLDNNIEKTFVELNIPTAFTSYVCFSNYIDNPLSTDILDIWLKKKNGLYAVYITNKGGQ